MIENLLKDLVQLAGFFGVFGFFVFQLINEKKIEKKQAAEKVIKETPKKRSFFRRG